MNYRLPLSHDSPFHPFAHSPLEQIPVNVLQGTVRQLHLFAQSIPNFQSSHSTDTN